MGDVRRRLVEIADELRATAAHDFAGKHRLNVEADGLRQRLAELAESDSENLRRWVDRSARKATHTEDDGLEAAKAAIVSTTESGSS